MVLPKLTGLDRKLIKLYDGLCEYYRKEGGLVFRAYNPDIKIGIATARFLQRGLEDVMNGSITKNHYDRQREIIITLENSIREINLVYNINKNLFRIRVKIKNKNKIKDYEKIEIENIKKILTESQSL